MKIFVGNLSFQTMDTELRRLFSEFGEVTSAQIATDNFTRRSRGFGFVEMKETEAAMRAIEKLHNSYFMTRKIIVNEGNKPREIVR